MSDEKGRYLQGFLDNLEKGVENMGKDLTQVLKQEESLRLKNLTLVANMSTYSASETDGLKPPVETIAKKVDAIQPLRLAMCERIDAKCIAPIKTWEKHVKNAKQTLKTRENAMQKMAQKKKALDTVNAKYPGNREKIMNAEAETTEATNAAWRQDDALNADMERLEKMKVADFKSIFAELIHTEMNFHAKALESLTAAYDQLEEFDAEKAVKELNVHLHPSTGVGSSDKPKGAT